MAAHQTQSLLLTKLRLRLGAAGATTLSVAMTASFCGRVEAWPCPYEQDWVHSGLPSVVGKRTRPGAVTGRVSIMLGASEEGTVWIT